MLSDKILSKKSSIETTIKIVDYLQFSYSPAERNDWQLIAVALALVFQREDYFIQLIGPSTG